MFGKSARPDLSYSRRHSMSPCMISTFIHLYFLVVQFSTFLVDFSIFLLPMSTFYFLSLRFHFCLFFTSYVYFSTCLLSELLFFLALLFFSFPFFVCYFPLLSILYFFSYFLCLLLNLLCNSFCQLFLLFFLLYMRLLSTIILFYNFGLFSGFIFSKTTFLLLGVPFLAFFPTLPVSFSTVLFCFQIYRSTFDFL